jgi:hypothetical protein
MRWLQELLIQMWPFKKKGDGEIAGSNMVQMAMALQGSFQRVRNDMDNVNTWLNYLYSQDSHKQSLIEGLRGQVAHLSAGAHPAHSEHSHPEMEGVLERLKNAEDKIEHVKVSVHSEQPVISRITELNSKISLVEQNQKSIFERLKDIAVRVEKAELSRTRSSMNLREKIIRKVARHSKEYIKNLILSTIGKYEQIQAIQLREMIVEEQGLCSKSTFYRLLEEIEAEDNVSMIARGKEKVYIPKIVKKH